MPFVFIDTAKLKERNNRWALRMVCAWAFYVTFWLGLFAHWAPALLDVCRQAVS